MTRDSTPAFIPLTFFAALFVVGARITPSPMKVAAAGRSLANYQLADELTLTGIVMGMPRVPRARAPSTTRPSLRLESITCSRDRSESCRL